MSTNITQKSAGKAAMANGGTPGAKLKEFLELGELFDGHIARELADRTRTETSLRGHYEV